jgi:hypothetical protein
VGRLLRVHLGAYALGALLLIVVALPVASPNGLGLDSVSWPLLMVPAVVLAAVGGLVEGLAFRAGRAALGWSILAVVVLLGMAAPLSFVGRWPGELDTATDSGLLLAAEAGWTASMALLTAVAVAVGRPSA